MYIYIQRIRGAQSFFHYRDLKQKLIQSFSRKKVDLLTEVSVPYSVPQIPCLVSHTWQLRITSMLAQCSQAMPCSTLGRCKEHVQARVYLSLKLLECWPCHYAQVDPSMFM